MTEKLRVKEIAIKALVITLTFFLSSINVYGFTGDVVPAFVRILQNQLRDEYCDSDKYTPEELSNLWNNLSAFNCSTQDTDEKFCSCVNKLDVDEKEQEGLQLFSKQIKDSVKGQIRRKLVIRDRINDEADAAKINLINYFQELIGDKSACIDPGQPSKIAYHYNNLLRTDRSKAVVNFRHLSPQQKLGHLSKLFERNNSYDVSQFRTVQVRTEPIASELDPNSPDSIDQGSISGVGRYAPKTALVGLAIQQHDDSFLVEDLLFGEKMNSRNTRDMFISQVTEAISAEYTTFLEKPGAKENKIQVLKEVLLNFVKGKCQELNRELAEIDPDSKENIVKHEEKVEEVYASLLEQNADGNLDVLKKYFTKNRDEYFKAKGLDPESNDLEALDLKYKYNIAFCSVREDFDLLSRNLTEKVKVSSEALTALATERLSVDEQLEEARVELENIDHFANSCLQYDNITGVECVDLLADKQAVKREISRLVGQQHILRREMEKAAGGKAEAAVFMTQMGFRNPEVVENAYVNSDGVYVTKSNEEILQDQQSSVKRKRDKARGSFLYDHMSAKAKRDHVQVFNEKIKNADKELSSYANTSINEYIANTVDEGLKKKPIKVEESDIAKAQAIYNEKKNITATTVGSRNANAESIIRRNVERSAEVEIDENASPIQNIVSNIQTQRSAIDTQKFESTLARLQSQYDKLDGKLQGLSDSYKSKDSELSSSLGSLQKILANVNDEVTVEEQKVEKLREQIKVKAQEVTQKKEAVAQQKRRAEQAKIKRLSPNSTAAKVTSSRAAPRVRTTASQGGGTPRVSVGSGGFGALPEISAREQYDLDLLALKKVSKPLSKGATPMNINQFSKVVNPDLTIKNGQEIPQEGVVLDDGKELTVFEVEEEGKQLVVKDRVAKKDVATGLNQQAKELKTLESEFYKYEQFMKLLGESQKGE